MFKTMKKSVEVEGLT